MSTPWLDNKNLSQKLYTALAWPPGVHERLDFPFAIQSISYVNGGDIVVALLFKEDKEELRLEDAAAGFPSQELLAQLNLLAGNVASSNSLTGRCQKNAVPRLPVASSLRNSRIPVR